MKTIAEQYEEMNEMRQTSAVRRARDSRSSGWSPSKSGLDRRVSDTTKSLQKLSDHLERMGEDFPGGEKAFAELAADIRKIEDKLKSEASKVKV